MIDVGANAGYFSLIWLAAHPENSCIAFEAPSSNAELLRCNAEANGLGDRLEVHALAAGREAGTLTFDPGSEEQTG